MSCFETRDITVRDGETPLLSTLSLHFEPGVPLIVLGETGSGKSLLAQAIIGTLPPELSAEGHVSVGERVLDAADPRAFQGLLGARDRGAAAGAVALARSNDARPRSDRGGVSLGTRPASRRGACTGRGGPRGARPVEIRRALSLPALRRHGAARGDRRRPRGRRAHRDRRRADQGARCRATRRSGRPPPVGDGRRWRPAGHHPRPLVGAPYRRPVDGSARGRGGRDRRHGRGLRGAACLLHARPARRRSGELATAPKGRTRRHGGGGGRRAHGRARWTDTVPRCDVRHRAGGDPWRDRAVGGGKSSLGDALLGLLLPAEGHITRQPGLSSTSCQKLYQNPVAAFLRKRSLGDVIGDVALRADVPADRTAQLLERLGLDPHLLGRRPGAVSGGDLQRLALLRILLVRPAFVFADEPTSRLDPITQAQVIAVLREAAETEGCAILLVSHDLALICGTADAQMALQAE